MKHEFNRLVIEELIQSLDTDRNTIQTAIEQLILERKVMEKSDANEARYLLSDSMVNEAEHGSLGDLNGCPCFHCLRIGRCGVRQPDTPVGCIDLQSWMDSSEAT